MHINNYDERIMFNRQMCVVLRVLCASVYYDDPNFYHNVSPTAGVTEVGNCGTPNSVCFCLL